MTFTDLEPAATRMTNLVRGTPDDRLDGPTPCSDYTVADFLDHISNDGAIAGRAKIDG